MTGKISRLRYITIFLLPGLLQNCNQVQQKENPGAIYRVARTDDFRITGRGDAANWKKAKWIHLEQRTPGTAKRKTNAKVLYSTTGIYFLYFCEDRKITATMNADFMDLWEEDVVEIFLWPNEESSSYFEYEISPLNHELPILISNNNGDIVRWQPFHYDSDRKTNHATTVDGGEKKSNATITSWMAEFYIPYKLLRPLENVLPKSGTRWKANLYRLDYDNHSTSWSWSLTHKNFHEYKNFGTFLFE